jgi:hypothetical protein
MAYDYAAQQVVLFSGIGQGGAHLLDTWVWSGANWQHMHPASSPPLTPDVPQFAVPPFTDPLNGHVDVFTVTADGAPQTWQWTGSDWIQLAPLTSPGARYDGMSAFDKAANVVVLYGGADLSNNPLTDTWTWNGSNWTQIATAANPGQGAGNGAAYDSQLKAVIMPNWATGTTTWEFTGTDWIPIQPRVSPSPRFLFGIANNPANGLPILFGGDVASAGKALGGTWEFAAAP